MQTSEGTRGAMERVELALGRRMKEIRETQGVSQQDLALELHDFGYPMDQSRISLVELGKGPPPPRLKLEVWIRRCGVALTDARARTLVEARELAQWFYELEPLVPSAITTADYDQLASLIVDLIDRGPNDIRTTRYFLQREIGDFLCSKAFKEGRD